MTEYKATPEQWDALEKCSHAWPGAWGPCILELRARVEALEAKSETQCLAILDWGKDVEAIKCWNEQNEQQVRRVEALEVSTKQWRTDHLRLANTCASLAPDRLKFFNALLSDDDNSQPTPNPSQIGSSLVEQVADGISKPLQLTPEQAQQINDLLAPNSKPTPNSSQIRSSLVERVASAIHPDRCADPILYLHEARAAIREMAAWLKETHGWSDGSLMRLEQEAER
jgi:hypothetical protein